jgi:hypothetical protein
MIYFLFFLYLIPLFIIYLLLCFTVPLIRIGKIEKGNDLNLYIAKDYIHADYILESKYLDLFPTKKKYIKIGWGDRKIFLETKSWSKLKIKDFIFAFFGLNKTTLRVEFLEEIPKCKLFNINKKQLEIIKKHIIDSYEKELIIKEKKYYQIGNYYKSNLNYNCITNCNNWINQGFRKARISNKIWCPITFWI